MEKVLHYFKEICGIPHGSGNTRQISDYLAAFAKERNLDVVQDAHGNIRMKKPATAGYETEPTVILQGHMDMVAVKDADCPLCMETDGLQLQQEGDYLFAKGTSLGGDDGIALAYALALFDADDIAHPALEFVATVDEETGMFGAEAFDASLLEGRRMLNIDSEEEGVLLTSCAGGRTLTITVPLRRIRIERSIYRIRIDGLRGGHSGTEIGKNGANALVLMGKVLKYLREQSIPCILVSLSGGEKENAIPTEAEAVIGTLRAMDRRMKDAIHAIEKAIKKEFGATEKRLSIHLEKISEYERRNAVVGPISMRLIELLQTLPNGVLEMSAQLPGMVQTSCNIGKVEMTENECRLVLSVRSSVEKEKEDACKRIISLARMADGTTEQSGDYPGWNYREESPLRERMVRVYERLYGKKPELQAIHAGLECGIFVKKLPTLDCISFGPDILDIHTTKERLSLSSTERTWDYLLAVLKEKD